MMRKKISSPNGGGYNNMHKKPRYPQGGGDRSQGHHQGGGRPRKNYAAMREKYLAQARDALSAGDRVLAENYFQHADHCYRMMVEEGWQPRQQQPASQQNEPSSAEQIQPGNISGPAGNALPAFLTGGYDQEETQASQTAAPEQNWEERDQ